MLVRLDRDGEAEAFELGDGAAALPVGVVAVGEVATATDPAGRVGDKGWNKITFALRVRWKER